MVLSTLRYLLSKQFIVPSLTLFTVLVFPTQVLAADIASAGSYESYTQSIDRACYAREGGEFPVPIWNTPVEGEVPEELITLPRFVYPDIYAPDIQKRYQEGLAALK
jgi:hypothetical protein